MVLEAKTKLDALLKEYPFLLDFLAGWSPKYEKLRNPLVRGTVGRLATLDQAAALGDVRLDELVAAIGGEISRVTGTPVGTAGAGGAAGGPLPLDTGALTAEQIDLMLTSLPVDISFVDEADTVVYYSATPERVFPRSPGVIGRKVQNCHPPKSVDVVERILEAFRSGKRDVAEFWIESGGKFIHIRYFALRDKSGAYKGTLEVSQDVTAIRALRGERRLLDWGSEGGKGV